MEINQCVGCTFSAMTRPSWLGRAVRNRHRHAIEQASRRWRGGRRVDSARTRRKILISTTGKGGPFKQILLDLYDPLGFGFRDMSAADKKKGLFAEINNGRMAMIGLVPCRHQMLSPEPRLLDGVEVHGDLSQYPQDSLAHWLLSTQVFSRSSRSPRSRARTRSTKSSTSTCRRATSTSWARSSPSSPRPSR